MITHFLIDWHLRAIKNQVGKIIGSGGKLRRTHPEQLNIAKCARVIEKKRGETFFDRFNARRFNSRQLTVNCPRLIVNV